MTALTLSGLRKSYGARVVLDGVDLTVRAGEVVALLGPSGAGKTTLFRCIARLTQADAGTVHLAGRPIHHLRGRRLAVARRDIAVVFQQFNLVRRLGARDNVLAGRLGHAPLWRVLLRRFSPDDQQLADAALERVGLADHRWQRADSLSGGQQQRVAIARALAQQSRVILADEPVASLDPDTAARVLGLLRELARERGIAVLCSLHQPALAEAYADRVLALRNGQLGTPLSRDS